MPDDVLAILPLASEQKARDTKELYAAPPRPEIKAPRSFADIAFSYTGRVSRSTFWQALGILICCHLAVILASRPLQALGLILIILWLPLLAWVSLAVQVKRWHDIGVTGWAVLINLVPVINVLVILLVLGMMRGKPDANEYGASPDAVPQ